MSCSTSRIASVFLRRASSRTISADSAGPLLHRQRDIVEGGELAKDRRDLERAGDAERGAARRTEPRDVAPGKPDGAGIGTQLAGERGNQGCLARAVRADHRMDLAGLD